MKNLLRFLLFAVLFFVVRMVDAQNITFGIYQDEESTQLSQSDPVLSDNYPYKNLQLNILAGEGVMLYMTSSDFAPVIYTVDTAVTKWVKGTTTGSKGNYSAYIILTPKSDTIIQVVYTTSEAHATGGFHYGIRKLSKQQMQYDPQMPFCERLAYLINNWQCYFTLLPQQTGTISGKAISDHTLSGKGIGTLASGNTYKEYFFDGMSNDEIKKNYTDLVDEIAACLPKDLFEQKSDVGDDDLTGGGTIMTTYFNIKGQTNEKPLSSFGVTLIEMPGTSDLVFVEFF